MLPVLACYNPAAAAVLVRALNTPCCMRHEKEMPAHSDDACSVGTARTASLCLLEAVRPGGCLQPHLCWTG